MEKGKQEIIMPSHIIGPFTSFTKREKVKPSDVVEKGTIFLDGMANNKPKEKMDLPVRNYSVTLNNKKNKQGIIFIMKKKHGFRIIK